MQRLEDADQTVPRDVQETTRPNHAEVALSNTQETETQADRKKEATFPQTWARPIGAFFGAIFTEKWVELIRHLFGATAYLVISFTTIILVEKGIFALVALGEHGQMLFVVEDIAHTVTVIFYVMYLFVTMLVMIKHLLAVFSL